MSPQGAAWIASAFAPRRFGGLEPCEACAASEEGSSLSLLAMTGGAGALRPQHVPVHPAGVEMEERHRRVVAPPSGGKALVELAEHVLGHGMRAGQRL